MPEKESTDTLDILRNVWGYSTFRPQQEQIIQHIVNGNDALVIMPTGGGKSLCYQVPALMLSGVTLVISPLIALMNDQVQSLLVSGVKVAAMHSNMDKTAIEKVEQGLIHNKIKLLYVSPERVNSSGFLQFLKRIDISLIAIDEAHCVSVWGNDFRPDYVELSKLRDAFQHIPCIALTATADDATQTDIIRQLHLKTPEKFISSFERKNIITIAKPAQNRLRQIIDFLQKVPGHSGIIYCLSRKETENLSAKLRGAGYKCGFYHAGMDASDRSRIQKEFQDDQLQFICATIAFGMGIDKSNIRWIIHYSMPKNLEGYYQEIGRAGRDGTQANALLFYGWGDYQTQKFFIDESEASEDFRNVQYAKLQRMWEFANATECRTNLVLNYFGEYRNENCGHCDNCLRPPKGFDGKVIAQKALSGIKRTNESIGLNMLIDILRGSYRAEVRAEGFDRLKTFGAGKDISFLDWKVYITQLINKGLIRIDYTDHFKLKCTPLSDAVLFGKQEIQLVQMQSAPEIQFKEKRKPASEYVTEELMQELKSWRADLAKQKAVPAYVIFADKVFENLVEKKPLTRADLAETEGIGKVKLEQYGDQLLSIIQKYISSQEHKKNIKGKTYMETQILYNQGLTPDEISKKRDISPTTVYSHIAYLYSKDEPVDLFRYISIEDITLVEKAWSDANKAMELAVIAENLIKPMEFHKIRLALAYLLKKRNQTE